MAKFTTLNSHVITSDIPAYLTPAYLIPAYLQVKFYLIENNIYFAATAIRGTHYEIEFPPISLIGGRVG